MTFEFTKLALLLGVLLMGRDAAAFTRGFYLMGTRLTVDLAQSDCGTESCFDRLVSEVKTEENRISTWTEESDFSLINRLPVGKSLEFSGATAEDLSRVLNLSPKYQPFFSPFLGFLIRAWGLRGVGRVPFPSEIQEGVQASLASGLEFRFLKDESGILTVRVTRKLPGVEIEEGGFGKGLALDRVRGVLEKAGVRSGRIDFGGQILLMGDQAEWIGVANPLRRDEALLEFQVAQGSIATSGNSENGKTLKVQGGSKKIGHLLDPRTGMPASHGGSVTVWESEAFPAELLSKIFVLGRREALSWSNAHGKAILWLDPSSDGKFRAYPSCAFTHPIRAISPRVEWIHECKKSL